ncbi:MAG: flavin reductase [Clostridia bacterium]|nr:flavin reductase [Clostridia bacterium]
MSHKVILPEEIEGNIFEMIGSQWALLCAGKADNFNMMTVSWGQLGVLWNKPVVTAYVRPQRHTKRYMDGYDGFTLNFFGTHHREQLKICGSKSGRDIDKMSLEGLTPVAEKGSVYFDEAELVLCCKKLYIGELSPDGFELTELIDKNYPSKDFHTFYIGEITRALKKQ